MRGKSKVKEEEGKQRRMPKGKKAERREGKEGGREDNGERRRGKEDIAKGKRES